jgi:hypothetical protein
MTINSISPWNQLVSPIPKLNLRVRDIVKLSNKIYVGGEFTALNDANQDLNYLTYWDTTSNLWMSVVSGNVIGTNGIVYSLEFKSGTEIYVGGDFTTGGATTLHRVGILETVFNAWIQLLNGGLPGVNSTVRDIYYSGSDAYICGDFFATSGGSPSIYRVAKVNSSNQILQITNISGSHIGFNNTVYSNTFISSTNTIYFGGTFTNASPTSDLPMNRMAYFSNASFDVPLVVQGLFIDTNNPPTVYTNLTLPARYNAATMFWDSAVPSWLVTYRSTGVTFS